MEFEFFITVLGYLSVVGGRFEMVNLNSCLNSRRRVLPWVISTSFFGKYVAKGKNFYFKPHSSGGPIPGDIALQTLGNGDSRTTLNQYGGPFL